MGCFGCNATKYELYIKSNTFLIFYVNELMTMTMTMMFIACSCPNGAKCIKFDIKLMTTNKQ